MILDSVSYLCVRHISGWVIFEFPLKALAHCFICCLRLNYSSVALPHLYRRTQTVSYYKYNLSSVDVPGEKNRIFDTFYTFGHGQNVPEHPPISRRCSWKDCLRDSVTFESRLRNLKNAPILADRLSLMAVICGHSWRKKSNKLLRKYTLQPQGS